MLYKDSGVNIPRAEKLVEFIKKINRTSKKNIGSFAAEIEIPGIIKDYKNPVLLVSTDGIGTKIDLALQWNYLDFLGYDLVGMCVNDIATAGAKPLFFLDYYAASELRLGIAKKVLKSIVNACEEAGCTLVGGETAELPGLLSRDRFDVAGFVVGIQEKERIPSPERVKIGDILIGFPSSGLHSNGYSLVRKIVNKLNLSPEMKIDNATLKEVLLAPTRIYSGIISSIFQNFEIHGAAHITGGGIPGNLKRVLNQEVCAVIDKGNWKMPSIFNKLAKWGKVPEEEMYSVFNMGIGFILIVDKSSVQELEMFLKERKEEFYIIGEITKGSGNVKLI
ncbi:MAG: phosphoribosylformylglycinamidine cyclo-ligase [Candidatus Hydrothermae bacterium]|nr:phosphoribosylformylglycinamidine cyclo-ligase [Candidatus Hydrothermae bacterium]